LWLFNLARYFLKYVIGGFLMMKRFVGVVSGASVLSLLAGVAMAAPDLTSFTVDTASVDTMAGIVLAGLAGLWGIRKLIKTINRS
jgi:hypothetical protein